MENDIQIKNLSYEYINTDNKTLKNINLNIKQGECIILCGKSGSGKTTLTRVLNGLSPSFFKGKLEGECLKFGLVAGKSTIEDYVPFVGSVFQNPKTQYFNVNTTSELAFPCENSGLDPQMIKHRIQTVSNQFGIESLLDRNIFHLSGGEKQRVAFASACMLKPKLLVLDEPTGNLDKNAIEDLKKLILKEKSNGTTIIMAEHRLEWTLDFADKYYYFENGVIADKWDKDLFITLSDKFLKERGLRASNLDNVKKIVDKKANALNKSEFPVLLEAKDLKVGYNKETIYNIKDFYISKGEIIGIMGQNGIGKSTFAKTICGILKPISGEIKWNKKRVNRKQLLKKSFMVMQDVNYQLFSDSVREEILLGVENPIEYESVLDMLGLLEYADRHPMSLSGGQKQRVAIASAIMSNKEVIIMDEPTSGLDGYNMKQVGLMLQKLKKQDKSIIVITHDEELVAGWCDRVVYL